MSHLLGLTPEQQAAVGAPDGPLLVVAGPGSGKTAVLAARIAYLARERGVGPASILALTFAAKAARELRERLNGLLGSAGDQVDVATFHSFGLRVVRQWPAELGFRPGPLTVYGEARAQALLREVAAGLGVDLARLPIATFAQAVEHCRLNVGGQRTSPLAALAAAYEAQLIRRNALDFAAMLVLPVRLLQERPAVARCLQAAYRAILVDEGQDVCPSQYALAQALATRHRQLVVVGDPAQALYGWRGADGSALRYFLRDFPEARRVTLRRTFRSTPEIVALANTVGAGLPGRQELWTANPSGPQPVLGTLADDEAEALFVAGDVARLLRIGAIRSPGDVAILCRTNAQMQPFLPALRAQGVPYQARGDLFARREIRDALAYLRLAHDPGDAAALRRVLNVPPRGLAAVAAALGAHPAPCADLVALAGCHGPAATNAAREFLLLGEALHREAAGRPPAAALALALERSGYHAWLARQPDGDVRLGHLAALHRLAERASGDLAAWLATVTLGDAEDAGEEGRVRLLTVHAAKGSEWTAAFLVGWEEGLLPHRHAIEGTDVTALEDERRVAYVAVSRPRERLCVTCCRQRRDEREARRPSRFLLELAGALVSPAA
ncbi:MAG: ATP-dependent helicase [Chloroflexota bacterium]